MQHRPWLMCRCLDWESKIDNTYGTGLIYPSMHALGRRNWSISLGHVKPLSSWLRVVAKSLDFYSIMMSAKAADPPNPGTFWAPDARTLIYKNGITAQQSSLDIEGNKDGGVGGLMTILWSQGALMEVRKWQVPVSDTLPPAFSL